MEPPEVPPALVAAESIAFDLGLCVEDADIIQRANRLTVRLMPCDVLVRIAPTVRRNEQIAVFELDMAQRLEKAGGPVAGPEPLVDPRVYLQNGFAITFWKYYEPATGDIAPTEYAHVLERLHTAMRRIDVVTPHFTDRVDQAQSIVGDRSQSPDLVDADRALLTDSLRSLRRAIVDRKATEQLLHGEPHPGNLLETASGMRFIDFETCCYGPVEFDIAHAADEVADYYTHADQTLIRDCRLLKIAMVASWRADRDDVFPNGREMRWELLDQLRKARSQTD